MIGIDSANLGRLSMNLHRSSNGVRNSVDRLVNAGNATESLRAQGDQGGLSMVSRLGSENRTKSALSKSMQNAVSYIQMQEAGLKEAHKIYERMSVLASQSLDPLLSDELRANLNLQFQSFKNETLSIRSETFQGSYLFDDMAMNMHRSATGIEHSTRRLMNSGDAAESMRESGDGGGLTMASRLGAENRTKSKLASSMQNAVSYIQMQEAGLKKAHQLYERMSLLASQAMDPLLSQSDRSVLSTEFETLRQDSLSIRADTYEGKILYDDIAAYVKKDVDFGAGLAETTPKTYENFSGNTDAWEVTKDVKFTSGIMTIDVNGGTSGERYILKQGSLKIFDTGDNWDTAGNAKKFDFDRFIVEYSPGQNTTFQFVPLSDGNSSQTDLDGADNIKGNDDDETVPTDSNFDNKSYYLANLGLADDGSPSGMDSKTGTKFTNQGQVSTTPANNETTSLTLRIESTSLFQIAANYSVPSIPSNYVTLGDSSTDSVTLDPVGIGLMQNVSISTAGEAASAVVSLAKEIEGIGAQMGTIGANMSKLEIAGERLSNQVYLSEMGISRLTSNILADESTQMAKEQIRLQSSQALMAQAFSLSENILNTLL